MGTTFLKGRLVRKDYMYICTCDLHISLKSFVLWLVSGVPFCDSSNCKCSFTSFKIKFYLKKIEDGLSIKPKCLIWDWPLLVTEPRGRRVSHPLNVRKSAHT